MNFLKKNWGFIIVAIVSLSLGGIALFTAVKLNTTNPVAPTVPQATPQAVANACTISFRLLTPTPFGSPTPTPSVTPTPTPSPTPTPTPVAQCNSACTSSSQCPGVMICSDGFCRNPSCTQNSDCICSTPTPTPVLSCNSSCTSSSQCPGTMICSNGSCRNPSCTEKSDCSCSVTYATPPVITYGPSCGSSCSSNSDCPSTMICLISSGSSSGICRNPSCVSESDCSCAVAYATPTPKIPSAPVPEVPVAGSILPVAAFTGMGLILVMIGVLAL